MCRAEGHGEGSSDVVNMINHYRMSRLNEYAAASLGDGCALARDNAVSET